MAILQVQIPDFYMEQLKARLNLTDNVLVAQTAFTLLNWAAGEKVRGRILISCNPKGEEVEKLAMEVLALPEERIRRVK